MRRSFSSLCKKIVALLFFINASFFIYPIWPQNTKLFQDGQPGLRAQDILLFSMLWRQRSITGLGDYNGDLIVNHLDLMMMLHEYQLPDPTAAPTSTFTPTATATSTATLTPTSTSTETATPIQTSTPTPTQTPTFTETPSQTSTATVTHTAAASPTFTGTPTPTATFAVDITPTAANTNTPSPTTGENGNPTPTITPGGPTLTPTNTVDPNATPIPTFTPSNTATPTVFSVDPQGTPTPSEPGNSPTPTSINNPGTGSGDPTPTVTSVGGNIPDATEDVFIPEFVREWNVNRPLTLFTKPVVLPGGNQIASTTNGYAVFASSLQNTPEFISFDRFGRIFRRTFPLFNTDFSSLEIVDGDQLFGEYFESPSDTRRFRFEQFDLDQTVTDPFQVVHLGADAIGWAFGGGEQGYAMTVLQFPNTLSLHRIDSDGSYLGHVDLLTPQALPLSPGIIQTIYSKNRIAALYSSDPNAQTGSILPLSIWIFDIGGNVLTPEPILIDIELERDLITGDNSGNFYFMGRGSRLLRINENGIELDTVLSVGIPAGMQWQDDLLWVLDGLVHSLRGYTEEALFHTGPVDVFPPGWNTTVDWLTLRKSNGDLGGFFTDQDNPNAIHYLQIEQGPLVTPTPRPVPGVPTGATISIQLSEDSSNTMELVLIPKGTYLRGSPESEVGRNRNNEGPQHTVTIRNDFFLGKYEVTFEQYRLFDPDYNSPIFVGHNIDSATKPVVGVSWEQATAFCDWLSEKTESTFRLPTEGEWEYACRAGTTTRRYWGDDPEDTEACQFANAADISSATQFNFTSYFNCEDDFLTAAPAGSFAANPFGLHDMLGNVSEWCQDWFAIYADGALVDPQGPFRGTSKIIRGGSWNEGPNLVRSARRGGLPPGEIRESIAPYIGFRVVKVVN